VSGRRAKEPVLIKLTLAEGKALKDATGFGGGEPTTPRELAALERALEKIERAQQVYARRRKTSVG
jgi:hypothetical protein